MARAAPRSSRWPALAAVALGLGATPAHAAGFHLLKVEAIGGVDGAGERAAGVGLSTWSDLLHAWATFGEPGGEGTVIREAWLESRALGPVLGVVPPAFGDAVTPYAQPALLPWGAFRLGGDASEGKTFEVDVSQSVVLNAPGFFGVDGRRAFAGPALGLGLNGTWWRGWKGGEAPVMTGKLTGEAGLVAGVTARDTWYAQGRGGVSADLFGEHLWQLSAAASTGLYLARVGAPVGIEITGEIAHGEDNRLTTVATTWEARATLYWKLAPPYQTRLEERVEQRLQAARGPAPVR